MTEFDSCWTSFGLRTFDDWEDEVLISATVVGLTRYDGEIGNDLFRDEQIRFNILVKQRNEQRVPTQFKSNQLKAGPQA